MTAAILRYPAGVRPLLIEEAARRRRIETRIVETLETAAFEEVVLPIIDYVEPYSAIIDQTASRQSYRFVDREGDLVAIRSDFTPMVARTLAPSLSSADLPLRVFYRGDVIRCQPSRLGSNREIFQIGAEIIGDRSPEADIETLRLAEQVALLLTPGPLIVYSDVSVAGAQDAASDLSQTLRRGDATLEDITPLEPDAAARLSLLRDSLSPARFALHLEDALDPSGYYTGLRFRVYAGPGQPLIAQGGRYDTLYGRFGTSAPAVGFTFNVDGWD